MADKFSAFDRNYLIVPIWMINFRPFIGFLLDTPLLFIYDQY